MRLIAVFFTILSLTTFGLGQDRPTKSVHSGWKEIQACDLTFTIPDALEQTTNMGIDSCVADFQSEFMWITIDAGIYGSPLNRAEWTLNFVKHQIRIGGKTGEFATYKDATNFQNGDFIAAIYVVRRTGLWAMHTPFKDSVNMTIGLVTRKIWILESKFFRVLGL